MKTVCLSELCKKEVICIEDGRKLGYPTDVRFDARRGHIIDLIVPCKSTFSLFQGKNCVKIRWCDVERIGEDVIWVCGCFDRKDNDCDRDNKRDDCCDC